MKRLGQHAIHVLVGLIVVLKLSSCTSTKDVPYFKDIPDSARVRAITQAAYKDPVILSDDILSVTITTIDPSSTTPVNQSATVPVSTSGSSLTGLSQLVPGLLVDKDGDISLPILGTIKVGGLTTSEAKAAILKTAEKYFKEPDVQIRFVNFQVTVMGEVERPATYTIPNEKISVLDALGMAGDLTIYGRRDNILVIREANGVKEMARLNINSSDIVKSPYFYLRQHDIVYVEPNKQKVIAADAQRTRTLTILGAFAAVLIVFFSRINIK